jgi:hypothetical protein
MVVSDRPEPSPAAANAGASPGSFLPSPPSVSGAVGVSRGSERPRGQPGRAAALSSTDPACLAHLAAAASSSSSRPPSVHRQAWHPPPTVESLDPEGAVLQPPAEQVAELLYRLDDGHRHAAAGEEAAAADGSGGPPSYSTGEAEPVTDADGRDESAHWARQRQQSRMGRKWWRRPNPYWSAGFLLCDQVLHR